MAGSSEVRLVWYPPGVIGTNYHSPRMVSPTRRSRIRGHDADHTSLTPRECRHVQSSASLSHQSHHSIKCQGVGSYYLRGDDLSVSNSSVGTAHNTFLPTGGNSYLHRSSEASVSDGYGMTSSPPSCQAVPIHTAVEGYSPGRNSGGASIDTWSEGDVMHPAALKCRDSPTFQPSPQELSSLRITSVKPRPQPQCEESRCMGIFNEERDEMGNDGTKEVEGMGCSGCEDNNSNTNADIIWHANSPKESPHDVPLRQKCHCDTRERDRGGDNASSDNDNTVVDCGTGDDNAVARACPQNSPSPLKMRSYHSARKSM